MLEIIGRGRQLLFCKPQVGQDFRGVSLTGQEEISGSVDVFSNNLDLENKVAGRSRRPERVTMRKGTKRSRLYKPTRKSWCR